MDHPTLCHCGREKHIPDAEFCGVCKIGVKKLYKEMQPKFWRLAVDEYFKKQAQGSYLEDPGAWKEPPPGMPYPANQLLKRRVL